jgi:hypothetical protein
MSKNLSAIEKRYVDFLGESADALMIQIKEVLEEDYDELELIYFVEYVICDLFATSSLTEQAYWKIVREFLKNHLFWQVTTNFGTTSNNLVEDLNSYSVQGTNRMNEYKNSFPLSEGILNKNMECTLGLIREFANNLYPSGGNVSLIRHKLLPIILGHTEAHIKQQSQIVSEITQNIVSSVKSSGSRNSSCFVATYIYSGYETTEVRLLRDFRDDILNNSVLGRTFIKTYNRMAPFLVVVIKRFPVLQILVKSILDKFILSLKTKKIG